MQYVYRFYKQIRITLEGRKIILTKKRLFEEILLYYINLKKIGDRTRKDKKIKLDVEVYS